jgi:GNAT superfamily N-acetyltransferase
MKFENEPQTPSPRTINLRDGYLEEDLFPKLFTNYEERFYGILFYNEENRNSYDSNHAVIYKDKIDDLSSVLADIIRFYGSKNLRPIIYQSMLDDGWFEEIQSDLADAGFKSWTELQEYMLPTGEDKIVPNPDLEIVKIEKWNDELTTVFLEAEEPWEIEVAKVSLNNPRSWMFAARKDGKTIGLLYGHVSDTACRGDYLLVSKLHRRIGAGRALFHAYVEWCKQTGIENAYLWPDGETPKRIYEEGGYELVEIRKAGRAVWE